MDRVKLEVARKSRSVRKDGTFYLLFCLICILKTFKRSKRYSNVRIKTGEEKINAF